MSADSVVLRPYQDDAVEAVRERLRAGVRRVLLYMPTGSGKTECAIDLARRAREKGRRVLFLANRVELVGQAWRRFRRSGLEAGVLQADNTRGMGRGVIIGSIHTLARRGCPEFDLLLVDEAHGVAGSKAYLDLFRAHPDKPVIGLSATPFSRGLGRRVEGLGAVFESIVVATTIRELIDLGFLVDVDIYGPSEPDLSGVKIVAGDYHEGELGQAVDRPELIGDIVTHWHRLAGGRQTVCFATSIAHSQHIVEQFQATGVQAEHIDAYTSDQERQGVLERFNRGETKIISNCAVLAEGWDSPCCEVMICARPTQSLTRWIQMSGRILRPHEGKARALILDHSGTARRLGFPTDDLPLELDNGEPGRWHPRAPETPLPEPCPCCTFLKPAKVRKCPACGFTPARPVKVRQRAGELVQVRRGRIAAVDKHQVFRELLGYAEAHGYKTGWAAWKYRELFGTWPARKEGIAPEAPSASTLRLLRHLNIRSAKGRDAASRSAYAA